MRALIRKAQAEASVSRDDVASGEYFASEMQVSANILGSKDDDGEPGSGSGSESE